MIEMTKAVHRYATLRRPHAAEHRAHGQTPIATSVFAIRAGARIAKTRRTRVRMGRSRGTASAQTIRCGWGRPRRGGGRAARAGGTAAASASATASGSGPADERAGRLALPVGAEHASHPNRSAAAVSVAAAASTAAAAPEISARPPNGGKPSARRRARSASATSAGSPVDRGAHDLVIGRGGVWSSTRCRERSWAATSRAAAHDEPQRLLRGARLAARAAPGRSRGTRRGPAGAGGPRPAAAPPRFRRAHRRRPASPMSSVPRRPRPPSRRGAARPAPRAHGDARAQHAQPGPTAVRADVGPGRGHRSDRQRARRTACPTPARRRGPTARAGGRSRTRGAGPGPRRLSTHTAGAPASRASCSARASRSESSPAPGGSSPRSTTSTRGQPVGFDRAAAARRTHPAQHFGLDTRGRRHDDEPARRRAARARPAARARATWACAPPAAPRRSRRRRPRTRRSGTGANAAMRPPTTTTRPAAAVAHARVRSASERSECTSTARAPALPQPVDERPTARRVGDDDEARAFAREQLRDEQPAIEQRRPAQRGDRRRRAPVGRERDARRVRRRMPRSGHAAGTRGRRRGVGCDRSGRDAVRRRRAAQQRDARAAVAVRGPRGRARRPVRAARPTRARAIGRNAAGSTSDSTSSATTQPRTRRPCSATRTIDADAQVLAELVGNRVVERALDRDDVGNDPADPGRHDHGRSARVTRRSAARAVARRRDRCSPT